MSTTDDAMVELTGGVWVRLSEVAAFGPYGSRTAILLRSGERWYSSLKPSEVAERFRGALSHEDYKR